MKGILFRNFVRTRHADESQLSLLRSIMFEDTRLLFKYTFDSSRVWILAIEHAR